MKKFTVILILALLLTVALTLTACDELCNHDIVIDEAVPATCTEGGFTEGKHCSRCFKGFVAQEKTPALGHTEVVDEAVPSTCTTTGLTEGKHCATCGEILVAQQVIDMCAHTEEIIPAVPSTCTTTGLTEGKRCTVCGKTTVEQQVVGMHNIVAGQARPATCTTAGLTAGKYCNVCGETIEAQQVIDALGHTEEILPAVPATCTTTGLTEGKHCTTCDKDTVEQKVVDALGHTEGAVVVENNVAPTCTTDGSYDNVVRCTVCEVELSRETVVVDAPGHTEEILSAVAPTCITTGLTEGKYCSTCDKVLVAQEVVDALGHTEEILSAVAPTCTTTGLTEGKGCSTCDKVLVAQEVVDALEHTEGAVVVENNVAPTCTTDGSYDNVVRCTVCEVELSRETVVVDDALGHVNNENGACVRCDYSYFTYQFGSNELGEYYDIIEADKSISGDIVIPSTYNGKPIRDIRAFAFEYCDNLTGVTVPDTVNFIGQSAFGSCDNLQKAVLNNTGLIFNDAFAGCTNLTDVTITNAYYIYDGAFDGCGFASITIPASVRQVTDKAFVNCNNLAEIKVDTNSQYLKAVDDVLYSIDGTSLILYAPASNGEAFVIPAEVTRIGSEAFSGCQNLKAIIIPNTVTKLGTHYNFNDCTSLTSVVIPDSVTTIGNHAFSRCDNLTSVTIPDSVTILEESAFSLCDNLTTVNISSNSKLVTIGRHVFEGYNKLTSITIPNTVTTIGERAFYNCRELTDVYFIGTEEEWNTIVIESGNDALTNATIHFITVLDAVAPTCTETGLTEGKYCSTCDKVLVAQEVVNALGHDIVNHEAKAPACTEIGWDAYEACSRCDYTTYAGDLDAIGHEFNENGACANCSYSLLKYVLIADGSAYSLVQTDESISGEIVIPSEFNGKPVTTIGEHAFLERRGLTNIVIPSSVTTIEDGAFAKCDGLVSINIPASVTNIGGRIFSWSLSLQSINVDKDNTAYKSIDGVLYSIDGTILMDYPVGKADASFEVPAQVTTIGENAFDKVQNLTNITFEDGSKLTTIEDAAFRLTKITEMNLPDGVTTIGDRAFADSRIRSIKIPASVVSIGKLAFFLSSVENVTFAEHSRLASIADEAFALCDNLTTIEIPHGTNTIGECVFVGCTKLTTITIPATVGTIGDYAFDDCLSLTDIYYYGSEDRWDDIYNESTSPSPGTDLENVKIHFIITLDAVAPTCTEAGLTEGKYCSTCDKVLVAQEVVDALGHDMVEHEAKAPTCTQIGWDAYEACSRCDYSTYNEIPATGHDLDENDVCSHGDYAAGVTYMLLENGMEYELVGVDKNVSGDFVVPSKFNGKPVTVIDNNAFSKCVNLTSIKIEKGYYTLTIESYAFARCARLKTIEIPSNVTKIEDNAFHNCPSLTDIYYYGSEDRWDEVYDVIVFPPLGSDLDNVKIHFIITLDAVAPTCTKTGLTEGKYCETCQKTVVAQESIDALGHEYDSNGNCWVCEDPEARYTLTEDGTGYTLERIANKNLAGTYVMEGTYNNKPITVIGKFAFDMCAQLESVVISDSVTTIEEMAFAGCTSLTSVVIPKSVTIIGIGAFALCDNLTDIYFTGTEAEWNALTGKGSLAGTSNVTIHFNYVPEQN